MVDFGLGIMLKVLRFEVRVLLAIWESFGYFLVFIVEASWHVAHGNKDMVGKAIGDLGREVVHRHAFADIMKHN